MKNILAALFISVASALASSPTFNNVNVTGILTAADISGTATNLTVTGTMSNLGTVDGGTMTPFLSNSKVLKINSTPVFDALPANAKLSQPLKFWYDASQIVQSNSTAVVTWSDLSGNGFDLTQSSTTSQPFFYSNIYNGRGIVRFDGSNDLLATGTSTFSASDTSMTLLLVYSASNSGSAKAVLNINGTPAFTGSSAMNIALGSNYQQVAANQVTAAGPNTTTGYNFATPTVLAFRYDGTSHVRTTFINGVTVTVDSSTNALGLSGLLCIGGITTSTFNLACDVCELAEYTGALTDTEVRQISNGMKNKWNPVQQVAFIGDSITAGQIDITSGTNMVFATGMALKDGMAISAWGINSRTSATITTDITTLLNGLNFSAPTPPVVVVEAGGADLYSGSSAASVLTNVKAICASIRAKGAKAVYVTPFPSTLSGVSGSFETNRQSLLASINADPSFCDALADMGNNPIMGPASATADTTLYPDGGHPSTLACVNYVGPGIANAIQLAIGRSGKPPTNPTPFVTSNTSASITFMPGGANQVIYNSATNTIASGTLALPATSQPGQVLTYATSGAVTSLTVSGSTLAIGTNPSSLSAGDVVIYQATGTSGIFIRTK